MFVIGEANFSDHLAPNRLGASALMQGLADGYFVLPSTINDYLAREKFLRRGRPRTHAEPSAETVRGPRLPGSQKILSVNGDAYGGLASTASSATLIWGRSAAWPATRRDCASARRPDP